MPIKKFDWLAFIKEHQTLLAMLLIIVGLLSLRIGSVQVSYVDISLHPAASPQERVIVEATPMYTPGPVDAIEELVEPFKLESRSRTIKKQPVDEPSPTPEQITPIVLTQITEKGDPYQRYK